MFSTIASSNVAVPFDVNVSEEELIERINFADINVILLSEKYAHLKDTILNSCKKVDKIFTIERIMKHVHTDSEMENLTIAYPDQVSLMLFTSGTTGDGLKAAQITQDGILASVKGYVPSFRPGDNVLSILPIHHCFELCNGQLKALYNGCNIFINDSLSSIMRNIVEQRINTIIAVPAIANLLCSFIESKSTDKSYDEIKQMLGGTLRRITIGGAPTNAKMIDLLSKIGIEVNDGYGLTESSGGCIFNWLPEENPEACGIPFAQDLKVKLADDGELLLFGKSIMKGYYKQPTLTSKVIEEGWLHTGDIATIKDNGYIVILGRKDNLIKLANGEKVYPEELEDKIDKISNVTMSMVCAFKGHLTAVIYTKDNNNTAVKENIRATIYKMNGDLPSYMRIAEIAFRDKPFITTSSMKIKRSIAIKELEGTYTREVVKPTTAKQIEVLDKVKNVLVVPEGISIKDNLFDLGLDSLTALMLSVMLKCSVDVIYSSRTIEGIASALESNVIEIDASIENKIKKLDGVNDIIKATTLHSAFPTKSSSILITGATGFLGSFIIKELLKQGYISVICLVRDTKKFNKTAKYYGIDLSKVRIVVGDITKHNLGMSNEEYDNLIEEVHAVFHTAAIVNHIGDFNKSYEVNVIGTKNVVDFCEDAVAQLYYMSTFAVTGFDSEDVLTENALDINQNIFKNIYISTKYKAEELVIMARGKCVYSTIFRVGNLTKSLSDGKFQINEDTNGRVALVNAIDKLGCFPESMSSLVFDNTSIDKAAEAIVTLAKEMGTGFIWHIMSDDLKFIDEVSTTNLVKITDEEFEIRVANYGEDRDVSIFTIYYDMFKNGFSNNFDFTETFNTLNSLGFYWR